VLRTHVAGAAALALAVPLLVLGAGAGTAAASDPVVFTDEANDVTGLAYLDVRGARISNTRSRIRITYTSVSHANHQGTETVWVDTNAHRPGPELEVGFGRYSEGWVTPLRNWKRDRSKAATRKWSPDYSHVGRCDRTVRLDADYEHDFTPVTVTIRKRKGCIASNKVRVHVKTSTDAYVTYEDHNEWPTAVRDDFPNGSRTFTSWVGRRPKTLADGRDPVAWWNDIRSVRAQLTADTLDVTINTGAKPETRYGQINTWIDVNNDSVPDYQVLLVDAGGGTYLRRISGWDDTGEDVDCGFSGLMTEHGGTTATFSLPTTCIGRPGSVRVDVNTDGFEYVGTDSIDWLGDTRSWHTLTA